MYYEFNLIQEVIKKNKIQDIVSEYVTLKRKSASLFVGLCPFHKEKAPTFVVDTIAQTYTCLSCGNYGNVITFVMKTKNCTFEDAISLLASKAGVFLPDTNHSVTDEAIKQRMVTINNATARYYHDKLLETNNAGITYFHKRNLSDAIIRKFGLGYSSSFGSELYDHLIKRGFSADEITKAGLCFLSKTNKQCDKFWDRVIFPIINENNKVIGFGGRVLDDKKPKYLNSEETIIFDKGNNLYGLNIAKYHKDNGFILCEGYMDVISLHQAGFNNAIASLGTALTLNQAEKISKYTKMVYLSYDGDQAGINAAIKAIKILNSCGITVKIIHMGSAKDPDEFVKRFGRTAYEKEIQNAENSEKFIIRNLPEDNKIATAAEILLSYV